MTKLRVDELKVKGKRVLMRTDFNVPLDSAGGITDATRIEGALPSIRCVLEAGGSLVLMSHLGRPDNAFDPELSLKPVARFLSKVLGKEVVLAPDCVGEKVRVMVHQLKPGEILLLENLRFHRAETHPEEDAGFAKELASFGDFYVNEAFGADHRKHSSTYTVASYFPGKAAMGLLLAKEVRFLRGALNDPKRPFCALIGGAKVSTKIEVLKSLVKRADSLLIGGAMATTFLKALGKKVGSSSYEEKFLNVAREIVEEAGRRNIPLLLPVDWVVAKECSEGTKTHVARIEEGIPEGEQGFDIGPETIELFGKKIQEGATVLWNGPMGVFELKTFAKGTFAMAQAVVANKGITIVAGGDTLAALKPTHLGEKMTHLSTGGGSALELIEKETLPCVEVLSPSLAEKT